jgi:hypothetical protein
VNGWFLNKLKVIYLQDDVFMIDFQPFFDLQHHKSARKAKIFVAIQLSK